jgi:hypothetical protein
LTRLVQDDAEELIGFVGAARILASAESYIQSMLQDILLQAFGNTCFSREAGACGNLSASGFRPRPAFRCAKLAPYHPSARLDFRKPIFAARAQGAQQVLDEFRPSIGAGRIDGRCGIAAERAHHNRLQLIRGNDEIATTTGMRQLSKKSPIATEEFRRCRILGPQNAHPPAIINKFSETPPVSHQQRHNPRIPWDKWASVDGIDLTAELRVRAQTAQKPHAFLRGRIRNAHRNVLEKVEFATRRSQRSI